MTDGSAQQGKCASTAPDDWTVGCRLPAGHDGQHRANMVVWDEPQRIFIGGVEHNPDTASDRFVDGRVRLSWEEPAL